jgi:pyruvate dehydrogenase E1 component alpha subunit
MYDADRYRDPAEIARWRERDPIVLLAATPGTDGALDKDARAALEAEIAGEIDRAVAAAEAAPLEPAEDLTRFVVSGCRR